MSYVYKNSHSTMDSKTDYIDQIYIMTTITVSIKNFKAVDLQEVTWF